MADKDKTIIYVQANILSVSDVDTISQTYTIEASFKLRWAASDEDKQNWALYNDSDTESKQEEDPSSPSLNSNSNRKEKPKEFTPSYIPKLTFPNAAECELMVKDGNSEFFKINKDEDNDMDEPDMIEYDFQIRCTFHEKFELENFPFDCQGIFHISPYIRYLINYTIYIQSFHCL